MPARGSLLLLIPELAIRESIHERSCLILFVPCRRLRSLCPDGWTRRLKRSGLSSECCLCDAPASYSGPCDRHSHFLSTEKNGHSRSKRIEWANSCQVRWSACDYARGSADEEAEPSADAALVAANTVQLASFLWSSWKVSSMTTSASSEYLMGCTTSGSPSLESAATQCSTNNIHSMSCGTHCHCSLSLLLSVPVFLWWLTVVVGISAVTSVVAQFRGCG